MMSASLLCPRCGTSVPIATDDPIAGELLLRVTAHECRRYLVAEHWHRGGIDGVWTSDRPGRTGPVTLVLHHGSQPWVPPPVEGGWTYRWVNDELGEGNQ